MAQECWRAVSGGYGGSGRGSQDGRPGDTGGGGAGPERLRGVGRLEDCQE